MNFTLLALAVMVVSVSAHTITLPLYSRAYNTSGLDVPVTDWFSRTDNQVSYQTWLPLLYKKVTDYLTVVHHYLCRHTASRFVRLLPFRRTLKGDVLLL